jgi:integrase
MPRREKPIREVTSWGQTRWKVRISITRGGQRKQAQSTFDTYAEAEQFYAQAQLGDIVPRTRDTFDDWADRWLARKETSSVRPNTMAGYRSDLKHPRKAFGRYRIQDITDDQVEALVHDLAEKGKSKRTVSKMLGTLRSVFELAMRKNVVRVNPAQDVQPEGRAARARDALTAKELRAMREAVRGDPWEACWMLTLAGLRRSELLALRWTDFNADTGELAITKGRGIIGGEHPPKTARGERSLPLDPERTRLLTEMRQKQSEVYGPEQADEGYICVNEFGRPMRPEDWSDRWHALCVGTEGVRDDHTLHAARHSTVTFMRNAGVPDHIVAAWHGHDEVVMRQTYSHAHLEQLKDAGSSLSFGSGSTASKTG